MNDTNPEPLTIKKDTRFSFGLKIGEQLVNLQVFDESEDAAKAKIVEILESFIAQLNG